MMVMMESKGESRRSNALSVTVECHRCHLTASLGEQCHMFGFVVETDNLKGREMKTSMLPSASR